MVTWNLPTNALGRASRSDVMGKPLIAGAALNERKGTLKPGLKRIGHFLQALFDNGQKAC
jgi:hypothetical protein